MGRAQFQLSQLLVNNQLSIDGINESGSNAIDQLPDPDTRVMVFRFVRIAHTQHLAASAAHPSIEGSLRGVYRSLGAAVFPRA